MAATSVVLRWPRRARVRQAPTRRAAPQRTTATGPWFSIASMRAAGIHEWSGEVETIDLADPRPLCDDEVLIEVRTAGVGNGEEFVLSGNRMSAASLRWHSASRLPTS
jgi:hypothetical protein